MSLRIENVYYFPNKKENLKIRSKKIELNDTTNPRG